jgi:hypothetical protein
METRKRSSLFISIFATLLVYVGAIGIYLYAYGWRFDLFNREVVKTGVLNVETDPLFADIYVNGESKGKTPKSISLLVGKYDIKVTKEGYHDWNKVIAIKQEKSTPIYPWLYKTDLVKENVYTGTEKEEYVKSWIGHNTVFFLTKDGSNGYIWKYSIDTAFWDLSSNPKKILSIPDIKSKDISFSISTTLKFLFPLPLIYSSDFFAYSITHSFFVTQFLPSFTAFNFPWRALKLKYSCE